MAVTTPPTYSPPVTPTPPCTCSAPELDDAVGALLVIVKELLPNQANTVAVLRYDIDPAEVAPSNAPPSPAICRLFGEIPLT